MPRCARYRVVLLRVLLFLPAALQAAESGRSGPAAVGAWEVLARVWSFLTGAQSDNGCWLDPSGLCRVGQSAPATVDNGCEADPNGHCRFGQGTSAAADNGCRLDPDGHCLPGQSATVTADNGCRIEPDGLCRN